MKDEYWMELAIEKAREGIAKGQTPFGACIVKSNRKLSLEHNRVWRNRDITAHAEIQAIRRTCQKLGRIDLSGCVIYSTCEPCPMCFSACHWARIDKIVYGAAIRDARRAGFNELSVSCRALKKKGKSPVRLQGGLMRQESLELFRAWHRQKNRRAY